VPPRVAVLIVTHDSEATIDAALVAAVAQEPAVEIHVWDNASRDGTRAIISRYPKVHLHLSEINLGFCAANNRLLERTSAPLVLFLNPDTRLAPNCVATLRAALESAEPWIACVGPKMIKPPVADQPMRLDSTGVELARERLSPHDRGEGEADHGQYDQPGEVFGVSFACALWRREAVAALTLDGEFLDEDFFAYYEDVDVAWRARRLGWRFRYEPRAICEHQRHRPAEHGVTLAARAFVNRYLLLIANEDGADGWAYLLWLVPREIARLAWKCLQVRGFGIAWRMLAAGWRKAWRKRHRLAALGGGIA
jgi:GT2 family glycosyltransferase